MTHVPHSQLSASRPSPPQVSNGMGRAGLLLAIGGLVLFWIPMVYPTVGVLAITLSAIGYSRARNGAATNGKSAMLGLVLGILSLVLPIVVLLGLATLILEGQQ
jgi:heme/copper-type cytochrome/quinol oxidase subunit 2